MAEEDDDEDDDPLCLSQTILEIDYQTNIDDKDLVDEFCVFKDTLQSNSKWGNIMMNWALNSIYLSI